MDSDLLLRNRSVQRLVVGVPDGHQHLRARIHTDSGDVVTLQEATLAALCRAYLGISTHPHRLALEMVSSPVPNGKEGFARYQLLEVNSDEAALRQELASPPPGSSSSQREAPEDDGGSLTADPFTSSPYDTTQPHHRNSLQVPEAALKTDHGLTEDLSELELDEPEDTEDDGPVFGDIPTLHSKPS